jgi:hypothetical protein
MLHSIICHYSKTHTLSCQSTHSRVFLSLFHLTKQATISPAAMRKWGLSMSCLNSPVWPWEENSVVANTWMADGCFAGNPTKLCPNSDLKKPGADKYDLSHYVVVICYTEHKTKTTQNPSFCGQRTGMCGTIKHLLQKTSSTATFTC